MTDVTGTDIPPANGQDGEDQVASVRVVRQFVRDVSFENPRAPESFLGETAPQMEMGVELNARGREDGLFDVELKLAATAKRGQETVFHVETVHAGLFQISGVPQEALEQVLLIECPRYLFPFARRLISDLTAEGGFAPLQLDPIDFAAVYAARMAQAQAEPAGNA